MGGGGGGGVGGATGCWRYSSWKLYGFSKSSCSWRVRLALAAKGVAYQFVAVNLPAAHNKTDEFASLNPMQQVRARHTCVCVCVCVCVGVGVGVGVGGSVSGFCRDKQVECR